MKYIYITTIFLFTGLFLLSNKVDAQVDYQWINIGDYQNFYGSIGSEIEAGFFQRQQSGAWFPAFQSRQDMQVAKGLWIGTKNFSDENDLEFPTRVIHIGPRVTGIEYFVPVDFQLNARYKKSYVEVNERESYLYKSEIDSLNKSLNADVVIKNRVNNALGLTMERTIYAYAHPHLDNFHIIKTTFINTGNVDTDEEIELPDQTLEDVVIYYQNRWAISRQSRYTTGNATGWGYNTMIDRRGDGITTPDSNPIEEEFKASFAWHGYYPNPSATPSGAPSDYDNIGAPIWQPNTNDRLSSTDTTGRLVSYQWMGRLHLSAPVGNDGEEQPLTMDEVKSDGRVNFGNDPFYQPKMNAEYAKMTEGRTQRHAYRVEPSGLSGFLDPSTDPSLGEMGGWSAATGYGPYTLAPGDSITIVYAEAAAGISPEAAYETGLKFKRGEITNLDKNKAVFQGRDSLFATYERIQDIFDTSTMEPKVDVQAPLPPDSLFITNDIEAISLRWTYDAAVENEISGFEIYRAKRSVDSSAVLIGSVNANQRTFIDDQFTVLESGESAPPVQGNDYYYYVVAVSQNTYYEGVQPSDFTENGDLYPDGRLRSSRYATQAYTPAYTLLDNAVSESDYTVAGDLKLSQNYPNPFNPSTKIAFSVPSSQHVRLEVYDLLGRKVATLVDKRISQGAHVVTFDAGYLSSGVYFYRLTDGVRSVTKKFSLMK